MRFHGRRVTKVGAEVKSCRRRAQDALDDILLVDERNDAHFP
jgi:hypothetical protein